VNKLPVNLQIFPRWEIFGALAILEKGIRFMSKRFWRSRPALLILTCLTVLCALLLARRTDALASDSGSAIKIVEIKVQGSKAVQADEMFAALVAHMNQAMEIDHRWTFSKNAPPPPWLVALRSSRGGVLPASARG
jgi:hypothetical protein